MLASAIVLGVGLPAVWIDTRTHRIPNVLVGCALLAAFATQLGLHGTAGLGLLVGGGAVGLAVFLPVHLAGAMGAGDVKLMTAFGALLGPYAAAYAVALTLVSGSALALATLGWRRWATLQTSAPHAPDTCAGRIPYAAAIVTGTLLATLISP